MKNKHFAYWVAQIFGWGGFTVLIGFFAYINSEEVLTFDIYIQLISLFLEGLIVAHIYRFVIIKLKWMDLGFFKLIPRILVSSILLGVVVFLLSTTVSYAVPGKDGGGFSEVTPAQAFGNIFTWTIIWVLWSVIYFAFHFFEKSRHEEIKNLQLEALNRETELNNLKSQLNPHFMFNSMNSIRALVEENPQQAKDSITRLSGILRSTLMMGKMKLVRLEEEMAVVKDYLALEKVRFEERLKINYNFTSETLKCLIPPMMLQTIVENGIKHGISKLTKGGQIEINAEIIKDKLVITVYNSGLYKPSKNVGIGLVNTRKRLDILFDSKAKLEIDNKGGKVLTKIVLPKRKTI